jgi:hypothetical protein
MKKISDLQKGTGQLNDPDIQNLEFLIKQIEEIIHSKEVSEKNLAVIDNTITTLSAFRMNFVKRLIKLLKRNHMLD